jgi:hypothetical protein
MGIAPNRLVAVLTPLVFAPLAGAVSVFAAEHLPGLDIDSDQLQQIFIAGALIAFGKAGLWLKGWQDWEKHQYAVSEDAEPAESTTAEDEVDEHYEPDLADADPDMDLGDEEDETEALDDEFAAIGRE